MAAPPSPPARGPSPSRRSADCRRHMLFCSPTRRRRSRRAFLPPPMAAVPSCRHRRLCALPFRCTRRLPHRAVASSPRTASWHPPPSPVATTWRRWQRSEWGRGTRHPRAALWPLGDIEYRGRYAWDLCGAPSRCRWRSGERAGIGWERRQQAAAALPQVGVENRASPQTTDRGAPMAVAAAAAAAAHARAANSRRTRQGRLPGRGDLRERHARRPQPAAQRSPAGWLDARDQGVPAVPAAAAASTDSEADVPMAAATAPLCAAAAGRRGAAATAATATAAVRMQGRVQSAGGVVAPAGCGRRWLGGVAQRDPTVLGVPLMAGRVAGSGEGWVTMGPRNPTPPTREVPRSCSKTPRLLSSREHTAWRQPL